MSDPCPSHNVFSQYNLYGHTLAPYPRDHVNLFCRTLPGSREVDFLRNNDFSLYNLYDHAPAQEPLPRRGREIYNFGRPTLSLYGPSTGVEKKIF